jgi:ribosomal protein L13
VSRGRYELNNLKSIKDFIFDKLRLNKKWNNIPYTNQSTGDVIIITRASAKEIAGHLKDGEVYQKTIVHIPQIIENMQFLDKMPADKEDAIFKEYSYYVIPAKIDGNVYTILSTIGYNGNEVYYVHNVFEGKPKEVFEKAKSETSSKYSRLNEILQNEKRQLEPDLNQKQEAPTASTNKYSKFFEEKQG